MTNVWEQKIERWRKRPDLFIEENMVNPEPGELYVLLDAEREFIKYALQTDEDGRLLYPQLIYAAIKKTGKTAFAAMLVFVVLLLFGGKYGEAYICANDLEQATSRVFEQCKRIVESSPLLRSIAHVTRDKIYFSDLGSTITCLASDYASAAGGHPTIAVFDELAYYTSERARRLYDELVPVPTKKIYCRLIVSHAGFEGDTLLQELYKRGLTLPEVAPDLHAGDGMCMFWSHKPLAPWQNAQWLAQMRRELRPNQYARMIENRFVPAESTFIDMGLYDNNVDPALGHKVTDHMLQVYAGVDASVKHNSTALALATWDQSYQRVQLCDHEIFVPTPGAPIDFTFQIERKLLEWHKRFHLRAVWYDPMQMAASAQRLTREGLIMVEFPQSMPNLTAMAENLFSLIKGRNLLMYADEQIRLAVSRTVATEVGRGWKLDKTKQSHHIDIVVALGMAALAAVRAQSESNFIVDWGRWV